jgi:hypothetical protein
MPYLGIAVCSILLQNKVSEPVCFGHVRFEHFRKISRAIPSGADRGTVPGGVNPPNSVSTSFDK